jgi:hypothetical protein
MRSLLALFLLLSAPALAAFQKPPVVATSPAPSPHWAAEIEARYTGSFLNPEDEARKSSFSTIAKVAFKASDRVTLQGIWGFNQIIEPLAEFTLTNPEFRLFYRVLGQRNGWSFAIGPTAALPVSQDAQDQSLYFAIGAATRLTYNGQNTDEVGFKVSYDIGFNRNVHQYETSNTNVYNTMSSIDHYVEATYSSETPFSLTAWAGFSSAWSYAGVISNNYTLGQEISYAVNDQWELAVGHDRGGDFLSPNGQAYNFGLFDAQESRFYLLAKLTF